jgi:heme A synthase
MSDTAKWVICAICAVLGIVALIYAVIYLAVPIHSLPGFVPGKTATTGHYHKRAFVSAVIGIVLLAIAVYLGMATRRSTAAHAGSTPQPASGSVPEDTTSKDAGGEGDAVRS